MLNKWIYIYFFFLAFFFRATSVAYGGFQVRSLIRSVVVNQHHSHSNLGSEPHLWPTSQLTATTDPQPTDGDQRSNPHPDSNNVSSLTCWAKTEHLQFFFFFFFFGLFRAAPAAYGGSQVRGRTGAAAAGLHHSHSNAGSLNHWVKPGIKLASSWILVEFANQLATMGTPLQFFF